MKSLTLGVCDDEEYVHVEIDRLLNEFEELTNIPHTLYHFYNTKELLETACCLDCLLLDIAIPDMDGIAAAKILRRHHKNYPIIILTSQIERYKEAFEIQAFRFVTKPIIDTELFHALNAVLAKHFGEETLTVYLNRQPFEIASKDILYIESRSSHSTVYTENNKFRSENTLKKWLEILNRHIFFQCHKSYIINLANIEEIDKNIAYLTTKEKIPVSRRLYANLQRAFIDYDTKYHY